MEIWTAGQIADSNGAYSGREVGFHFDDTPVVGTLDKSDRSVDSDVAILTVNGDMYWIPRDTTVAVA